MPFGALTRLDVFDPLRLPSPGFALSGDELTVVVSEQSELRSARRSDVDADFPQPTNDQFINVNQGVALGMPTITSDGLDIYFTGDEGVLLHASRTDLTAVFAGAALVKVNGHTQLPNGLQIASDGKTLFWVSLNDNKLHAAAAVDGVTFNADAVVSTMPVLQPAISADGLRLYYAASSQVLVSVRTTLQRQFEGGTPVAEVNDSAHVAPLAVTADDCELYFSSDRSGPPGKTDLWRARRGM